MLGRQRPVRCPTRRGGSAGHEGRVKGTSPAGVAAERFRSGFGRRRGQLAVLGGRGSQVLLLAGLTGVVTGLAVTGFEWVTRDQLFEGLRDQPIGVQVVAPLVGLMLAQAILRWIARTTSPATA